MATEFEEAWQLSSPIEGWLTKNQARALFDAAREVPEGAVVVEIGSHKGRSTVLLAKAKGASARLLAIDPFEDARWGGGQDAYRVFLRNLRRAGLEHEVEVHRTTSVEASRLVRVGLVYVDGAHDRESVLIDIACWEPLVIEGGFVYVHDAFSSVGVTAALLQRHLISRSFRYEGSVGSLAKFRREKLSVLGASWNAARLLSRLVYFCRNLVIKVALKRGFNWIPPLLGHRGSDNPF